MDESSRYTSKLEWIWVIEALASFKEVDISILHDLIEIAPELPHNLGRNMREMLALRCLEGLFGPSNGITNASCSAPASKVCFDFSKSCEDVLQHIVHETSPSDLRTAGPELLKWDVRPFIIHKRACMPKLALQQLKDSILDGSHPYTDCLKEKSGLAFTNAGDPHDGNLLPSKRKKNALATENMVGDFHEHQNILNDCGDPYINAKKQKRTSSSSQSIEENSVPVCGTELLEHLSESDIPVVQQEGCNLAKDQIGTLEEGRVTGDVNDEYTASMRCGHSSDDELHRIQSKIPDFATTMHPDTCGDEPHQNISVDEVKDDSEHCAERRTLTGSLPPYSATMMGQDTSVDEPCQKNSTDEVRDGSEQHAEPRTSSGPLLEKTRENESQCNFEHDVVLKAPHAASLDGAQQKIIDYEAEEDMDRCCEAGTSSDSDGYHKDHIDVSMKKHDFLSSQCTFSHDSLAGWTDTNLCVKCNEGGQLLVCNTSHCPLVVHEICLGSSPRFDNNGNFYCHFCAYSLAISEYLEAKKKSSLARTELTEFVRGGLEHQQKEVLERLHREKHSLSRKNEDGDPPVKSHENGYLEERVNDQTEETSEDEKNKSIISNYSIRVRRQEMHYKYPISPQLRRKNVPWTAEEEEILKLDESSIATSSTKTKRGRLNTVADTATPIRGAKRVRKDTRQGTRGQGSGKTKSQSGCQSTTTTQMTQPPTAHFAAQSTTTRTRTNAPSASQPVRSTKTATPATSQPVRITKTTTTPSAPQPVKVAKTTSTTQHYAYKANGSTIFANKKKTTLGFATRSRTSGRLRAVIRSGKELNNKPKLMIDLTGNPAGPPPIPGGGPVCSWGPPRAGGITFRIAPPSFDIHKGQGTAADKPSPSFEGVQRMENGKGKSTTTNKDKGKKKCGNYEL